VVNRESRATEPTLRSVIGKTVVVHTVTYFVAGVLAYTLGHYEQTFAEPPLSYFMRQTSDPVVRAGVLFQPIRGLIFALAFYPLRSVLFGRNGWPVLWWLLVALGILSTFGPAPGSIEGMVYTVIPPLSQVSGLWETLLQTMLFALILCYWVTSPGKRWLTWTLTTGFAIVMVLPVLAMLAPQP
jgi:hypothetical protein